LAHRPEPNRVRPRTEWACKRPFANQRSIDPDPFGLSIPGRSQMAPDILVNGMEWRPMDFHLVRPNAVANIKPYITIFSQAKRESFVTFLVFLGYEPLHTV
jgi:hypothetical protein